MAAYATATDVSDLAPQIGYFSVTSKPSLAQVTAHCEDVTREVDAVLHGLGYQTPIVLATSPIAYARVKTLVAWAGLAFALASRTLGVANPDDHGAGWARKEYERRLAALRSSTSKDDLVDAVRTADAPERDDVDLLGATASTDGYSDTTPTITREQVF